MSATEPPEQPVLIVDDEADSREALALLLEHEGYRVALAAHGQEALSSLHERLAPCLILLDLEMPVMNGWEFLRRLQAEERLARIPVLVLSGMANRHAIAAPRGAVGWFTKPVRIEALLAEMEQWCGKDGTGRDRRRDETESTHLLPRGGQG